MRIFTLLGAGIALLLLGNAAFSQQLKLGKNPYTVQKSAVLELNSDNQGLLLVRISDTTSINSLTPPDGMIIFFTPTKQLLVRSNGYWQPLAVGSTITSLNGLTGSIQTFATGITGTDFTISSAGSTHTFNIPSASAIARGVITTGAQTIAGAKTLSSTLQVVATNPLTLTGVQAGTSTTADSLLTITSGLVRKLPMSTFIASTTNYWALGGNTVTTPSNLGTIDNNDLPFITNNTEKMRLTATGSLGIGTTAPATPLHISASNGNLLYLQTLTSGTASIIFKTYTAAANPSAQISVIDTNFSGHFTFSTKAPGADANAMVERVRISAIGNVGIGTTTPGQKLDVRGAIVSSATTYPNYAYNSANRMAFGETNVPANETGSVVQYGSGSNTRNMLFAFTKTGVNTSYFGNDGTQMMLGSESTTPITFRTGLVYSSANVMASGTEVMRLTSAGLLGIGTAAPATALHVVATTNPLTLFGVQAGTSTTADSLLTITSGLVRKLPMSTFISTGNAWALGGNTVTTAKNLGTIDNNDLPFITNNTEKMRLGATGNLGVGSSSFNATNPEKLLVQAGATTSFNLMQGHGKINNYLQLNIQNDSAGTSASSDLVATADNGNESVNFIDMGINSSANSSTGVIGGANNAYLYGTGNDFSIGNSTSGKNLLFFTGGTASSNEAMRINGTGQVGIGTSAPATALHVVATTNPLTLIGVQTGTSTTADSLLTITSGLIRKLPMSTFLSTGNAWALGGNTVTTIKTLGTIDNNHLPFITNNVERMRISNTGNLGIGASSFNVTNPEKLLVQAGTTTSFNLIQGHGKINSYLQLNIQNDSAGVGSSSDLVATADDGNEAVNYVDLGINSSVNTSTGVIGGAHTAYLYGTGNDFSIGNASSGKSLLLFTGGTNATNERMRIDSSGKVGIGTTTPATALHVVGTNPLTLVGVQTGTSTSADSVLTITSGLVRKLPMSTFSFSAMTAGSIPFIGTGGGLSQNNANLFWDATNNRLGIGTNTPGSDFTLYQSTGVTSKGFRFTGNSVGGTSSGSGFTMALGFNQTNNKQLWLGDPDYLGNSAATFIRYSSSNGTTIFDAISGDNNTRRSIRIGYGNDALSTVILGDDGLTATPGSYVWANGSMAIGNGYRANSAPNNGLIVQGNVGIGTTTPTAALHLPAGTATANTAPLKFTSGTNLTTPENGAVEFNGTHFYGTVGSTRYQLDQQAAGSYTGSNGITLVGSDFRNNLTTGVSGGQTATGGTAAGNSLTLSSTTNATKGKILFGTSAYDEVNNRLGIATASPSTALAVNGTTQLGALGNTITNVLVTSYNTVGTTTITLHSGTDITATIPAVSGTNGTVQVSFAIDLPSAVIVAWARVISTTSVKIHLVNCEGTTQTIASGTRINLTIIE